MEQPLLLSSLLIALASIVATIAVARLRETRAQTEIDRLEADLERAERRARRSEREHDEEYLRRVRAESRLDRVLTSVEQAGLHGSLPEVTAGERNPEAPVRGAVAARDLEVPPPAEGAATKLLAGKRVLLVEDGEDTRRLVEFLLQGAGASVVMVGDGAAAVEAGLRAEIEKNGFDLILMDRGLPILDGLSATRQLREGCCNARIIALSASDLESEIAESEAAGCDGFIRKPIDLNTFITDVTVHLTGLARQLNHSKLAGRSDPVEPMHSAKRSEPAAPVEPVTRSEPATPEEPVTRSELADPQDEAPEVIVSEYAGDESMGELIMQFVEDLESDMHELKKAVEQGDIERIQVLSHQLKGSAGSYGFTALTEPAEKLERKARTAKSVDEIGAELAVFQELCARVRGPELD